MFDERKQWVAVFSRWVLGLVFGAASVGKFTHPESFAASLDSAGFSQVMVPVVVSAVPAIELCIALALLLGWKERLFRWTAFAGLCAFTAFLIVQDLRGNSTPCSCFGGSRLDELVSGPYTGLLRNMVLVGLSIVGVRVKTSSPLSLDRMFARDVYE